MAEHKFPTNWETTNQLKLNQVKSSQRLVFVERRKAEHPEINVSARAQ